MPAIDVTNGSVTTATVTADTTFTFSGTPAAGALFSLLINNTDADVAFTVTFPSSRSIARNATVTTCTALNNGFTMLTWNYIGSTAYLFGDYRGILVSVGQYTTLVGFQAAQLPVGTADFSVFVGYQAGRVAPDGGQQVCVGYKAGYSPGGYAGTFVGYNAGFNGGGTSAVGIGYSTFSGSDATGVGNIAIGVHAGETITTLSGAILVGYHAGTGATNATDSVIIGDHAGDGLAAINDCIFIGPRMGVSRAHTLHIGSAVSIAGTLPLIYGEFDNRIVHVDGRIGGKTLRITTIPTSASGLSSGDVWSNLGILTIVP